MRLLFIAESFPTSVKADFTGGVEARDWYISTGLSKKHQVTVLTTARKNSPKEEIIKGVRIVRVGIPVSPEKREHPLARLSFIKESFKVIPRLDFDLIQGSNVMTQVIAAEISNKLYKPSVALIPDIFIGSWIKNTGLFTGVIGEIIEPMVMRHSWQAVISWSESTKLKLIESKINTGILEVIPGGISLSEINKIKVAKSINPTIITAARLVPYKHIDVLIQAVALLAGRYPKLRLQILGDGPERSKLLHQIKQMKLESKVKLFGQVENHHSVLKSYKAATLFSLPSSVEGFGLSTLEACAAGLPFVNMDIPATRELTNQGEGGFLVPQAKAELVAEKIDELLSSRQLYNTKVHQCLRLAKKYDWNACINKTEKLFHKVIKNHTSRRHH